MKAQIREYTAIGKAYLDGECEVTLNLSELTESQLTQIIEICADALKSSAIPPAESDYASDYVKKRAISILEGAYQEAEEAAYKEIQSGEFEPSLKNAYIVGFLQAKINHALSYLKQE